MVGWNYSEQRSRIVIMQPRALSAADPGVVSRAPWCEDLRVTPFLEYGDRRFQVLAYHDVIRHDGPALELAEVVDGEVGPALLTVLFSVADAGETKVLLTDGGLPFPVVTEFLEDAIREQHRLGEQVPPER